MTKIRHCLGKRLTIRNRSRACQPTAQLIKTNTFNNVERLIRHSIDRSDLMANLRTLIADVYTSTLGNITLSKPAQI